MAKFGCPGEPLLLGQALLLRKLDGRVFVLNEDEVSVRELARELTRLARAIESLASEIKSEFSQLRQETVRYDVYAADRRTDKVETNELIRRIDSIEVRAKSLTTAFTGMLLSVMGGVIIFLITRGLSVAG